MNEERLVELSAKVKVYSEMQELISHIIFLNAELERLKSIARYAGSIINTVKNDGATQEMFNAAIKVADKLFENNRYATFVWYWSDAPDEFQNLSPWLEDGNMHIAIASGVSPDSFTDNVAFANCRVAWLELPGTKYKLLFGQNG